MSAGRMPLSELMAFMVETPENPTHIGTIQIFESTEGDSSVAAKEVLNAFRDSEVDTPFNLRPRISKFGRSKWEFYKDYDPTEHVLQVKLPKPGSEQQLLELVTGLHAGMMDRNKPCWQVYVIEGLGDKRFALYLKIQHAYFDGAAMVARFNATMKSTPGAVTPFYAPLPKQIMQGDETPSSASKNFAAFNTVQDLGSLFYKAVCRYSGFDDSLAPLPLSAPNTLFNSKVGKTRSLGAGSLDLTSVRAVAKEHKVTINDLVLTLVGEALERYSDDNGNMPERELVATCPMNIRRPGDSSGGNQIAGVYVRLGLPGSKLKERLLRVHLSAKSAKEDARSVSPQALMGYLILTGGTAELLGRLLPIAQVPRQANVNISNVPGPGTPYYLGNARMIRTYPVSTLAGGTAMNITFGSLEDHLDYSVVADGKMFPDVQSIADYIANAFEELLAMTDTSSGNTTGNTKKPTTSSKRKPRPRAGKPKSTESIAK